VIPAEIFASSSLIFSDFISPRTEPKVSKLHRFMSSLSIRFLGLVRSLIWFLCRRCSGKISTHPRTAMLNRQQNTPLA
jgi:hypothetical protein